MGDVLPPLHSPYAALKAMQFPPQQKPGKLRGLPLNRSKKYPLPVNGCHPCPAAGAVCLETREKVTASRQDITGLPDIYILN